MRTPGGRCSHNVVIPGRSGEAAEGKGIQETGAHPWVLFPRLRRAGDDLAVMSFLFRPEDFRSEETAR